MRLASPRHSCLFARYAAVFSCVVPHPTSLINTYAAHAAQGGRQAFTDTRLPFFMDSEVNQRLCDQVHRPAAPFGFFPYLNVFDEPNGQPQPISGDGVIEGFVARRLGLVGADETEAAVVFVTWA